MPPGPRATPLGLLGVAAPRYSLLSVPGVVVPGEARWANGIEVEPEGCDVPLGWDNDVAVADDFPYWWECASETGASPVEALGHTGGDLMEAVVDPPAGHETNRGSPTGLKSIGHGTGTIASDPIHVWAGYTCSSLDSTQRRDDIDGRLTRRLNALTPPAVEHELWTGEMADFAGFPNPAFMDLGTVENLGWFGYVTALAELEQAVAERVLVGRSMIHAQPRVVTAWAAEGLVGPNADRTALVTTQGTVVVPGHGYPGTAPAGLDDIPANYSQSYVYATGWVNVWLGPVSTELREINAFTADRDVNDVELRAERATVTIWDSCTHIGARVSLCDRLCGVGS